MGTRMSNGLTRTRKTIDKKKRVYSTSQKKQIAMKCRELADYESPTVGGVFGNGLQIVELC